MNLTIVEFPSETELVGNGEEKRRSGGGEFLKAGEWNQQLVEEEVEKDLGNS